MVTLMWVTLLSHRIRQFADFKHSKKFISQFCDGLGD